MTEPLLTTNCLSRAILDAFQDGRLDAPARRRVIEHMRTCGDCRNLALTIAEPRAGKSADHRRERHASNCAQISWQTLFSRVAAAAAAAVLAVFLVAYWSESHPASFGRLISASGVLPSRPVKGRLSGDFPYKRYDRLRNDASGAAVATQRPIAELPLLKAFLVVREDADRQPTVDNHHALGVSYVLVHRPEDARRALQQALRLETGASDAAAAVRRSMRADLLNDFAAACQELIETKHQLMLRPVALEAIERAWTLKKTPAIAFTRALIIGSIGIRERALGAWNDYLALDPSSDWSEEAKRYLNDWTTATNADLWPRVKEQLLNATESRTVRQAAARFPQETRLWCEDELLSLWGDATLRNDVRASALLGTMAHLGRALREANGERDVDEAVKAIQAATPADRVRLARGHLAYGRARKAIVTAAGADALAQTELAVTELAGTTPFVERAKLEHAAAVFLMNDYPGVIAALKMMNRDGNVFGARVEWLRGMAASQSGALGIAIGHFRRSLERFERAGEADHQSMLQSLLAAALEQSGEYTEAEKHRVEALRLLSATASPVRRHIVVFEAANAAINREAHTMADLLLDYVVANDIKGGPPFYACTSTMRRGAYRFRRGLHDGAQQDLIAARDHCSKITDPVLRERAMANLGLAGATLRSAAIGDVSLRELDATVEYFRESGNHRWLRTAYVARGRAAWALGSYDAAEGDFRAALEEIRHIRRDIEEREKRISFTATADDITDTYVEFLLDRGRDREAFEAADRSRSREYVDSPEARWRDDNSPDLIGRLQTALATDAAVVAYRIVGNDLVAWVVTRSHFSAVRLQTSVSELRQAMQSLGPDAPAASFVASGSAIYDALVRPLLSSIGPATMLILVPDGDLEGLPFAALRDARGRPFAATYATVVAPSAGLFLQSRDRWISRNAAPRMVIIERAGSGSDVEALPAAVREASAIATLFPGATRSQTGDALPLLPHATHIHFTGHTTASGGGTPVALHMGSSVVTASEIAGLQLDGTKLVYLSACGTDDGPVLKGEGPMTLSRAFFGAGVPVVIGTLWPVDDSLSRVIAVEFYTALIQGLSPAAALREAQVRASTQPGSVRADWAAFRVVGGGVPSY